MPLNNSNRAEKMFSAVQLNKLACFVFLLCAAVIRSEDASITIPLNKTLTNNNKELFGEFVTIASNSTLKINLININEQLDFIIFQVHSHLHNITLYNNTLVYNSSVSGTNVGLYGTLKSPDTYFVWNRNQIDLKLYISVHGYGSIDPIPGGCNMESPVPISPFMQVRYTKDMVFVDAPAGQDFKDKKCLKSSVRVEFYRMYLNARDFKEDSYFEALRNMMTWVKIQENGEKVPSTNEQQIQRRFLTAYPGTGSVYVAVAHLLYEKQSYYSIYVPTYTYACSPIDGCHDLDDYVSTFCGALILIGLFTCFFGHRFFKTEMFLIGMFTGVLISFIALSSWSNLDRPALLGASLLSGTFFGAIWIVLWWFYGIPILSVALTTMHFGFLVAAITYHCASDGNSLFANDGAFWTIFVLVMLCTCLTLTPITYLSNIACCAVLGAYAVVFAIDHFAGSHMKYIVKNTIRRAIVQDFHWAILALPYQSKDALLTVVWVGLAISGFLVQHYHNRGKPPFPPPPRSINRMMEPINYGAIEHQGRRSTLSNGGDRASTVDETTSLLS